MIAEKPSVAQDIVKALTPVAGKFEKHDEHFESERFVVTSAVGHLLEIQAPEEFDVKRGKWSFAHLPVIPPYFDLKPVDRTKARLAAVVRQAKRPDVTELINACDAGREGELIFQLIMQYASGSKPLNKPVRRLWLQSMTPQAIRDGFDALRTNEQMHGLADAARSRSEADWLVGINGTRAMTAFNSRDGGFFLTTVGRVQTPTLAIVVEREEQIRKFVSRAYWEVHASFLAEAGDYPGKWFDPKWKKSEDDAELKADRVWSLAEAQEIADAVRGKPATVTEEAKPTTQASPMLFDLTSLQREANGRFGFSAKTTLSIAQSLYERHKALTYPRTDSRALPQDYLPVVRQTFEMLAKSSMAHLRSHARTAIDGQYIKPTKRVFDDAKVSDHFAIIPTLEAPKGLSEAEQKLYDLVARRFLAVFFPSAEYLVTTRISVAEGYSFKSEGKVLVRAGWLAIYGKEAQDEGSKDTPSLVPVKPGESVRVDKADTKALNTRPPARFSEATLLGAMEGAGKYVEDDELREAMQEKGLGTPATRASIIEGLLNEKYMLRDGRELIPTPKAFQLMTLLRGLGVEELSKPELTGEWEYKLAQIEHGELGRKEFMGQIAEMTHHIVKKAKEYDHDTVPGDYSTLTTPCPNCGGVVVENYRRYACTGKDGNGCGFSFGKNPGARTFESAEVEQLLADKRIGPLEGFRSKAGWPFTAVDHSQVQRRGKELEARVRLRQRRQGHRRAGGLFRRRATGDVPERRRSRVRDTVQLCLRERRAHRGKAGADLRFQEPEGDPAAADRTGADDEAARDGQDRSAREVHLESDATSVQGLSRLGQGSREGQLRVCAVEVSVSRTARGGTPRTRSGRGRARAGEESQRQRARRARQRNVASPRRRGSPPASR